VSGLLLDLVNGKVWHIVITPKEKKEKRCQDCSVENLVVPEDHDVVGEDSQDEFS